MSTRRLIVAALVCGLAILVAGGLFLVNLAANRDELTVTDILAVGQSADVDGIRVTVLGSDEADDVVTVMVRLEGADASTADAGDGWALVIGSAREPVSPPPGATPCRGEGVPAGAVVDCDLAFAAADGTGYVEYAHGDERARWRLE